MIPLVGAPEPSGWQVSPVALIEHVRVLSADDRLDEAIDLVYDTMNEAALDGRFLYTGDVLLALARSQTVLPLSVLLSGLTITMPWREQVRLARDELIAIVRRRAFEEGGQEEADDVLRGLE